jgi:hypothetical protein
MRANEAAYNALKCVLEAVQGERIVVVCDDEKIDIGHAFSDGSIDLGLWTRLVALDTDDSFRKEVPRHLLEILTGSKPDIYINLLRGVGEETPFRIKLIHIETRLRRTRLGHCPGVNMEMLTEGALAMTANEHRGMQSYARDLMGKLEQSKSVEITSPSGTNLTFSSKGRPFFTDTLVDWKEMKWMNLPTGEVIVAPVENSLEGKLVCDLAIGGIGLIESPVELEVKNGAVINVKGKTDEIQRRAEEALKVDQWAKVVGEFAFGINPKARLTEEFLEAEKMLGTTHIAFGNNLDMTGGRNPSNNHTDFLFSKPTVKIRKESEETIAIMEDGKFTK